MITNNQQLKNYIYNGFPSKRSQLPDQCRRYWNVHNQLTLEDDLIVLGCCLLITLTLRHSVLAQLYGAQQGSVRTNSMQAKSCTGPESIMILTTSSYNASNVRRPSHLNHVSHSSPNPGQPAPFRKSPLISACMKDNSF